MHDSLLAQVIIRLIHFIAGIIWVGFLYFFVLVRFGATTDVAPVAAMSVKSNAPGAPAKSSIIPPKGLPRALWFFRWASVLTVLSGIWYWMIIIGDAHRAALAMDISGVNPGRPIWTFFALWTLAFIIYMGAMMSPAARNAAAIYIIAAIVVIAAAWLYISLNQHGWENNRMLAIGIGGGMGWFMMFNVWGILWRAQKKMIRWTAAGETSTPDFAKNARWAYLASRVNFVLSFPLLFFMAAASHYPLFIQS